MAVAPDIDPTLAIRDGDIRRFFPPAVLSLGRSYEQRGRVQDLEINERGAIIRATTQGTRADPYRQSLKVTRCPTNGLRIAGACSCPAGRGCKHLAAVLLAVQRKELLVPKYKENLFPEARRGAASSPAAASGPLPPQVQSWLTNFDDDDEDEDETGEEYPVSIRTRVYYVLSPESNPAGVPRLTIDPMTVALRKDNSAGSIKRYAPHQVFTPAKYLRPSDKIILTRLARRGSMGIVPADEDPADTLKRILATARARWGNAEGEELVEGQERQGQIVWATLPDGSQQAVIALDEGLVGLRIPDPWYVDPKAGIMGPVAMDVPMKSVLRLLDAPPIPPEAATEVRSRLSKRPAMSKVPVPTALDAATLVNAAMRPHIRLITGTLPADPSMGRGSSKALRGRMYSVPLLRLSYDYGSITLPRSVKPLPKTTMVHGKLYEIVRDRVAESNVLDDLKRLGFGSVHELVRMDFQHAYTDDFALRENPPSLTWLQIVTQEVPRWRKAGWLVETDDDFPVQVVSVEHGIDAELVEGSGIDWLELHLGVEVDGKRIDLVPALIRLLGKPEAAALLDGPDDKPFVLPLPDGRTLTVPMVHIRPTFQALLELWSSGNIDEDAEAIGFSKQDAADLSVLEERTGLTWHGGESVRELGRVLRESGGIPKAVVPTSFKATLRQYQEQGVDWLQFLGAAGLGGILADDMGLGKTVQTLAHLMIEREAGRLDRPSLIVCPTSLIPNWLAESKRFAPDLSVLALHGANRKQFFDDIPKYDVVLSTYPLLTRDADVLLAREWHTVILDEAQSIKNPNAETTRQALRLKAHQRLCLSGTPLQNHLGELWSLFDFLAPGFLGSQKSFKDRYRGPIEKNHDDERRELLSRRIRPFMLRRTKEEVVTELPPKTEIIEPVEMEAAQRSVYEAIRLSMHSRVQEAIASKGLARSGIVILDALLKMRQACCDPRLLKLKTVERSKAGSAKLDRLMEMLSIMFDEGRRVLLFSQFTEMLALIEDRLKEDGVDYVKLTGDTKDRGAPVRRFQEGEVPLFLISLKAGGVGLNLTAADTVIHYDPWWNPAVEDQATDRAYRIGQTKKVFVHRLVTLNTIEEKMEDLKEKKRSLVSGIMEAAEHGGALGLTEADIAELFGPVG